MRSTLVAARSFKKYVVQHGVPNLFSDPWTLELCLAWLINSAIKPYVMCNPGFNQPSWFTTWFCQLPSGLGHVYQDSTNNNTIPIYFTR